VPTNGCSVKGVFKTEQDSQCRSTYKSDIQARSRNHCCRGKAIIITYSEFMFVHLVIQNAMRMGQILSSLAYLAVLYFST